IIDGRYHTECGHFYAMATRQQDCLRDNCVFSARHTHRGMCDITYISSAWVLKPTTGCRAATCIHLMALPVRNPIRVSPTVSFWNVQPFFTY
ncbi:hypothetical protein BDZ89DRAFT_938682, partial [Hymenopellis radicata]